MINPKSQPLIAKLGSIAPYDFPRRFTTLWQRIARGHEADRVIDSLATHYSESHRSYHNLNHIADCLHEFDSCSMMIPHPDDVEIAIWFHDVVYDPRGKSNEEQSADMAEEYLKQGNVHPDCIHRVKQLILSTRHAVIPQLDDERWLCDIDLSILGRDWPVFEQYDLAIRGEYDWVPISDYRLGRAAVLKQFLARQRIYQTDSFFERYETNARANLARTLALLEN